MTRQQPSRCHHAFYTKFTQNVTRRLYATLQTAIALLLWFLRNTIVRCGGLIGQHENNEGVIKYLREAASNLAWVVHRAAIGSGGT